MKSKEQYWIKTASGWTIKTAFSGNSSMHELSKIGPEEGLSPGDESQMAHEDFINDLMKKLKQILESGEINNPEAHAIIKELHENDVSADRILSYIFGSEDSSNKISDEEISGMM